MVGTGEILVIMLVILILFGGKKLPEFAQSLGKGIREFKKACNGEENSPCSGCDCRKATLLVEDEKDKPKDL